jgi:hypothetical protein
MQIAEPVFRAALQSMLEQSYPWIDIHVMCDGPQQGAVGDYLSSVHDSRLYVHQSESNRGLARSLNELIGGCLNGEYEYFARMDADDVSELDRIRRQVVFLGANSTVAVVGTACVEIDGEGNQIAHVGKPTSQAELRRRLPVLNPFVHPSVMLRAEVFRAGHRYPERWRGTCEDYALWVQLQRAGYSFANLSDPLIRFRSPPPRRYAVCMARTAGEARGPWSARPVVGSQPPGDSWYLRYQVVAYASSSALLCAPPVDCLGIGHAPPMEG